nr:DUF2950 family protein [Cupriavidus lacunae]
MLHHAFRRQDQAASVDPPAYRNATRCRGFTIDARWRVPMLSARWQITTLRGWDMIRLPKFFRRAATALGYICLLGLGATHAFARQIFDTPDAAMAAFGQAVRNNDETAMRGMLDTNFRDIIPPVGADVRNSFNSAWAQSHRVQQSDKHAFIVVGDDGSSSR